MEKTVIIFFCVAVCVTVAKPASNEQLDKATANDVAINTVVAADKKADVGATLVAGGPSSVGIDNGSVFPTQTNNNTLFKPQKASTMFARFIDDIFQIPISVLTSVARLITNPFTQHNKTPEASGAL